MKFIFAVFLGFFANFSLVQAYEFSVATIAVPYEIVPIAGEISQKHVLLGTLDNFPIMYELTAATTTTLITQLAQRYESDAVPLPLSLIIVRQNDEDGGVTEVARINPKTEDWSVRKDSVFGMSFWESSVASREIQPGTYRVEVSTAVNQGHYVLTLGDNAETDGYFATLGQVRTMQKFFGLSFLSMLLSSYVYYPIGILLLLYGFFRVHRYRKALKYA
ncbi:MAG: hypothetical protein RLZZ230_95 [Candidatus Parcubacteria bacterium]|jgi:hypothetical protein